MIKNAHTHIPVCACVSNNKIIRVNSVIVNVRSSCCYNIKADSTVVIANIMLFVVNAVRLYLIVVEPGIVRKIIHNCATL